MWWLLLALGLVGCGSAEPGRLVVMETLPSQPVYIEGSVAFLRVTSADGRVIVDGPVTDGHEPRGRAPLLSRSLPAGEYRLVSFQRPCQGNCSFLDPPADRCRATVEVGGADVVRATVVLGSGGGCSIRVGG